MPVVLLGPHLPVGEGASQVCVGPFADDQLLAVHGHLAQPRAHAYPMRDGAWAARRDGHEVETDRAVDRALLDRISAELAVLGIDPRHGEAAALLAIRPHVDAETGPGIPADQKVAIRLVRDDRFMTRVVSNCVAEVRALDVPVVMEEDTAGGEARLARHLDVPDEPVARQVDEVLELDGDPQAGILEGDRGDERVLRIAELPLPARVFDPRELTVDEEARPADVAHGLVGVAD